MFVSMLVVAPGAVAALGSGNAAVGVIKPVNEDATWAQCDRYAFMLHFQKLDVYQRAIEFLTLANRIRGAIAQGQRGLG